MTKSAAIGIICKAPQPGRAKTRLASTIGVEAAAELSACFPRDVAAAIESVPENLGRKGYGVYAPAGAEEHMRRVLPPSFGLLLQVDAVLGKVLHGATRDLLTAGHDCVILVNGDSPTLIGCAPMPSRIAPPARRRRASSRADSRSSRAASRSGRLASSSATDAPFASGRPSACASTLLARDASG